MMTGNLLLMAFSIGVGTPLGNSARYVTAILSFVAGALLGGRLLRGPQNDASRNSPVGFRDRSRLDRLAGDGRQSEANGYRPGAIASVGCAQPSVPSHTPKEHPN
jgi:hypothetical protein